MTSSSLRHHHVVVSLLCCVIVSGMTGAIAAVLVTQDLSDMRPTTGTTATSTTPAITYVQVERQPLASRVPPEGLFKRSSPVANIYRKPKGLTLDERVLTEDRLLGRAVALSTDGWFVTTQSVIGSLHLADMVIWHHGTSYTPTAGVIDHINGTVYLKILARDLTVPAFARSSDLTNGGLVWLEHEAQAISPMILTNVSDRLPARLPVSSEMAARRVAFDRVTVSQDQGAAGWDDDGALVGIVESAVGEPVRLIPVTSIASSFTSLIEMGKIQHALLGVRSIDASVLRVDGDRGDVPERGAVLHDDRVSGKVAVTKDSPAMTAGLKVGDVILAVDRDMLDGIADLGERLSEYKPGSSVTLRVLRATQEMDLPAILGTTVTSEALK